MTKADKLWNATHSDFKAVFEGKRYVIRTRNGRFGYVPVEEAE